MLQRLKEIRAGLEKSDFFHTHEVGQLCILQSKYRNGIPIHAHHRISELEYSPKIPFLSNNVAKFVSINNVVVEAITVVPS